MFPVHLIHRPPLIKLKVTRITIFKVEAMITHHCLLYFIIDGNGGRALYDLLGTCINHLMVNNITGGRSLKNCRGSRIRNNISSHWIGVGNCGNNLSRWGWGNHWSSGNHNTHRPLCPLRRKSDSLGMSDWSSCPISNHICFCSICCGYDLYFRTVSLCPLLLLLLLLRLLWCIPSIWWTDCRLSRGRGIGGSRRGSLIPISTSCTSWRGTCCGCCGRCWASRCGRWRISKI